jgi:hypothetical protein
VSDSSLSLPKLLVPAAIASAVNLGILLVGRASGEDFIVAPPGQEAAPIPLAMPVISTILPALLAFVIARLCLRTSSPRRTFLVISVVAFVLFLANPIMADATTTGILLLELMHVVVFAAIVPVIARALPEQRG